MEFRILSMIINKEISEKMSLGGIKPRARRRVAKTYIKITHCKITHNANDLFFKAFIKQCS